MSNHGNCLVPLLAGAALLVAVAEASAQPAQGQMPMMGQGQMPMMGQGQMPMMGQGQMPMMGQGRMPMMGQGQMPMMGQGRMPMMGQGQMPMMGQGQRPMMGQGDGPGMRLPMASPGRHRMAGMERQAGWPIPALRDLTVDDVRRHLEHHLAMIGNPRLKLGPIADSPAGAIVADITTADGSLVQRVEVDRRTGRMRDLP